MRLKDKLTSPESIPFKTSDLNVELKLRLMRSIRKTSIAQVAKCMCFDIFGQQCVW